MKKVVSVSLGPDSLDCRFRADFLGQKFQVQRIGTNGSVSSAADLIREQRDEVDAIGLGQVHDHYCVGTNYFSQQGTRKLEKLAGETPVTSGARLREIVQEWSLRSAQAELGNIFNNAKVLFLSGSTHYRLARVMSEYTENLSFADPVLQFGAPNMLHSLRALELYAGGAHPLLRVGVGQSSLPSLGAARYVNKLLLKGAVRDADVVVASYPQLEYYGLKELEGKTVITSTISDDRLSELRDKGVRLVIDCSLQLFPEIVGLNVVESMVVSALDKAPEAIAHDNYLEIFTDIDL